MSVSMQLELLVEVAVTVTIHGAASIGGKCSRLKFVKLLGDMLPVRKLGTGAPPQDSEPGCRAAKQGGPPTTLVMLTLYISVVLPVLFRPYGKQTGLGPAKIGTGVLISTPQTEGGVGIAGAFDLGTKLLAAVVTALPPVESVRIN